jgi:hypothetical protein
MEKSKPASVLIDDRGEPLARLTAAIPLLWLHRFTNDDERCPKPRLSPFWFRGIGEHPQH